MANEVKSGLVDEEPRGKNPWPEDSDYGKFWRKGYTAGRSDAVCRLSPTVLRLTAALAERDAEVAALTNKLQGSLVTESGADPAFVASPSSRQGVSTEGFNPGEGA